MALLYMLYDDDDLGSLYVCVLNIHKAFCQGLREISLSKLRILVNVKFCGGYGIFRSPWNVLRWPGV